MGKMKSFFIQVLHEEPLDSITMESITGGYSCTCHGGSRYTCTCHGGMDFNCKCDGNSSFGCTMDGFTDKPVN